MNKSLQYNQLAESEQCKSEVEEMHLPKPWNWSSISENTRVMLENPLEGTMYESGNMKVVKWDNKTSKWRSYNYWWFSKLIYELEQTIACETLNIRQNLTQFVAYRVLTLAKLKHFTSSDKNAHVIDILLVTNMEATIATLFILQ